MNIDLHKVLSSVPCVNIVLYQKNAEMSKKKKKKKKKQLKYL